MKKKKKLRKEVIAIILILIIICVNLLVLSGRNKEAQDTKTNNQSSTSNEFVTNEQDKNNNSNSLEEENSANNTNSLEENTTNNKTLEEENTNNNTNNNTTNSSTDLIVKYPKLPTIDGLKENIGTTTKGYEIVTINGLTYIDGYLIANKTYGLPSDYIPENTVESAIGKTNTCNKCINVDVYNAFKDMQSDAAALGLNLYISSGYRPYLTQQKIYNNYVARDGIAKADTYSSRAGHSEHQSGLCFDINIINDTFANTEEGKWVNNNAYLYGFVIRYPKGKESETGYKYESWHLRYVGTELAYKLYNNGDWLSIEDYFGITSTYQSE